eukprot:m.147646 g.147646  ORF g.147646 m.147646 type:complete len:263 (+) comp10105_c0_seq2:64-852(+)
MCLPAHATAALVIVLLAVLVTAADATHIDNWAVIVGTSRHWHNYRHAADALAIYHTVRRLQIPDSRIILMLADDYACNARNPFAGHIYHESKHQLDLYESVEVDYRGPEVTSTNLLRVLTGRHHPNTPMSKRLQSTRSSNVLVFLAGHGADNFLKFQDTEEITSEQLGDAFSQMYAQQRYNEVLLMIDTCHAETLLDRLAVPGVIGVTSSNRYEDSVSVRQAPSAPGRGGSPALRCCRSSTFPTAASGCRLSMPLPDASLIC